MRIWDAQCGEELLQLQGHEAYIHALALHPEGRILASASGDNTVRIWDSRPMAERLRERDRVLAAEREVLGRVEHLLRDLKDVAEVVERLRTDEGLDPLHRHAAVNVALRLAADR